MGGISSLINKGLEIQDLNSQVKELNKVLGESTTINQNNVSAVRDLIDNLEDFDDGINYLDERLNQVAQDTEEYSILLKKKIELEEEYAKKQRQFLKLTGVNYKDNKGALAGKGKSGGMLGKAGWIGMATGIISDVINIGAKLYKKHKEIQMLDLEKEHNTKMAQQQTYLNSLSAGGKILQRNIQQVGKTQKAVLSSVTAQLTQGATEGAYAAAKQMGEAGVSSLKNMYDSQLDLLQAQNANTKAWLDASNKNLKLTNKQAQLQTEMIQDVINPLSQIPVLDIASAGTNFAATMQKTSHDLAEKKADWSAEEQQLALQIAEKKREIINNAKTAALETAQGIVDQVLDLTKSIEKVVQETEKMSKETANLIGLGSKGIDVYNKFFFNAARNLKFNDSSGKTIYLDKDTKDMQKMQSSYNDATGRNQIMGKDDIVKTFQLGKILGDDNLAATLLGDMDYFNKSIENGTDLIYKMFKTANKAGISNKKFAKSLQDNLKLAQKYTFKGGVKGMMEMSIWAQKTRFNLESLGNIIDKGLTEGLQGVIQQSAKLQVLGGNASMLSNPLAMLYEYGNDPGATAKRINQMTAGFGMFNSQTGEVDFSFSDNLHLRSIAETFGMDPTELRNQATQRIKSKQIDKHLTANYNDERKSLLYNKAQMDPETKKWFVTMANGEKKDINKIQDDEWAQLMPTEEAIEDYVSKIYNIMAQEKGVQNYSNQTFADETREFITKEQRKRIDEALTLVDDPGRFDTIYKLLEMGAEYTTQSQMTANEQLVASTSTTALMFEIMIKTQKKTIEDMKNNNSQFKNSLLAVKAELDKDEEALAKFEANILGAAAKLGLISGSGEQASSDALVVGDIIKDMFDNDKDFESQVNEAYRELTTYMKKNHLTDLNNLTDEQRSEVFEMFSMGNMYHRDLIERMSDRGLLNGDSEEDFTNRGAQALWDGLKVWQNIAKEKGYTPNHIGTVGKVKNMLQQNQQSMHDSLYAPGPMADGFAQANGTSMMTSAAKVTAINDGSVQLAKSHPQDSALFAKSGGPFDTLFNKVFAKVDAIYNGMGGSTSSQSLAPIQLNINGELNLKSGNQSVDLIGLMESNPQFVATMSQLIVTQLSKNVNGGKTGMFEYLRSI